MLAAMDSPARGVDGGASTKKEELPRRVTTDLADLPRAFTERMHELSTLTIKLVSLFLTIAYQNAIARVQQTPGLC